MIKANFQGRHGELLLPGIQQNPNSARNLSQANHLEPTKAPGN